MFFVNRFTEPEFHNARANQTYKQSCNLSISSVFVCSQLFYSFSLHPHAPSHYGIF